MASTVTGTAGAGKGSPAVVDAPDVFLKGTVAAPGGVCGVEDEIHVVSGTEVHICWVFFNNDTETFVLHGLSDDQGNQMFLPGANMATLLGDAKAGGVYLETPRHDLHGRVDGDRRGHRVGGRGL